MSLWLLDRLFEAGDQPKPRFALQGTVNWMRALAEIVNSGTCEKEELKHLYSKVQRRKVNKEADNVVFENMLMAYNNLSSLNALINSDVSKYDIASTAIVTWYYSIYFAGSAMIAAASGSKQETHATTARVWQVDIVQKKLIPYPFDLYLNSLVDKTAKEQIKTYRNDNPFDLNVRAGGLDVAHGGLVSYLKGTQEYMKWQRESQIKSSRKFKELNVDNFRTKKARELRDIELKKQSLNFLNQSFRYRGKAHYRDSIFLSYGDDCTDNINQLLIDLGTVSNGFIRAAAYYCSMRTEKGTWIKFVEDIEKNTRLSLNVEVIKI